MLTVWCARKITAFRTEVLDHKAFPSREAYDQAVVDLLRARGVELVVLAGFMRLLSPVFVKAYSNRIMNIHPALAAVVSRSSRAKESRSSMACAFPAARCISSMKSATRGRSSSKPWCRYFPTIPRNHWRRGFSSKNTASIRGRSSSMPRVACMSWDAESSSMALPRTIASAHSTAAGRMKKAKPVLILFVKLVVSGGLLAYFLSRIHIERFLQTFATANFSYIALALVVYLFTQAISAVSWADSGSAAWGSRRRSQIMLRYYLIGMFFNLFAPGTVGGDVSRVYYLVRETRMRAPKGARYDTSRGDVGADGSRDRHDRVGLARCRRACWLFPDYAVPPTVRSVTLPARAWVSSPRLCCCRCLRRVLPEDGHPIVVKLRLSLAEAIEPSGGPC